MQELRVDKNKNYKTKIHNSFRSKGIILNNNQIQIQKEKIVNYPPFKKYKQF